MRIRYILLIINVFLISLVLNAQEFPQIYLQPLDQTVCEGDSAGFVIEASGMGVLKYQWQKDEIDLEDETDSIYIIPSVTLYDTGSYRCIVMNNNGSDTTDSAVLTVDYVLPTNLLGPHEVENYDTALFSVVITTGHSYEFFVEEGIVLETSDTSVLVEWDADEVGYVKVLESSANSCYGDTTSRLVIVGNVVPFFLSQPVSQTVCIADSVSFEAPAAGTSNLHYQWQLNGEDLIRETDPVIGIPSASLDDEGDYRCIVTNTVGSDTSDVAELDIDYVELAEIFGDNIADVNDTIEYNIVPQEGHSYEFSQTGGTMLESTDTSITVLWDTAGISYVYLVETNTRGCQSDTVNYQVLVFGDGTMIIFLEQPENQGVCLDDSVSFTVYAAGYPELIYQWQKDEVDIDNANDSIYTIPYAQYEDEAAYSCIVSNDFGIDTSELAVLNVDVITPGNIIGPQYVKEFEITLYSVAYTEGHVYQFEVDGGNIIETTQNTITVHWGGSGYGEVKMLESVENGCVGEWVELDIYVGTVGIEPVADVKEKIYPNPVSGFVNVKLKGQNIFRLYNILGNLVLEKQFEDEIRIDLTHLEQGMYLYRIDNRTGRLIKK